MVDLFLVTSVVLLVVACVLLILILIRGRTLNIHGLWALALKGDRWVVLYFFVIGLAFLSALIAVIAMIERG